MTTIAQKALNDFEDSFKTINYTGMTAAQKTTFISNHYALKIAAVKETEANRIESEAQSIIDIENRKQLAISKLQTKGFNCDNSQSDWYKVYNRPEIFGVNWQKQADYQMSISPGVDYFLNKVRELIDQYL
jgi:hypothetical protein